MENDLPAEETPRLPEQDDLVALCRELNARGALYLVVGGMAVIQHGYLRATEDIDLLVEDSRENQRKVYAALETLPDKAILELGDADLRDYVVVRVADEVLVDLMQASCGVTYQEAADQVRVIEVKGVPIPFAAPRLLLRMKQTMREKDAEDRVFLYRKIADEERGETPRG